MAGRHPCFTIPHGESWHGQTSWPHQCGKVVPQLPWLEPMSRYSTCRHGSSPCLENVVP
jgi:hypothetical protein